MGLLKTLGDLFDPQKKRILSKQTSSSPTKPPITTTINVRSEPPLARPAPQLPMQRPETLDDMVEAYRRVVPESREEIILLEKINRNANSFEDWLSILDNISPLTSLGKRAIDRVLALASSDDDWQALQERSNDDSELALIKEHCVSRKEEGLSDVSSLEGLISFWDDLDEDSPLCERVIAKLGVCTESFEDWLSAYEERSDLDDLTDAILKKAISLAKTPDDWKGLWDAAENANDEDLGTVKKAFESVVWDEPTWEAMRDAADDESELETIAFKKLVAFKATVVEVLKFYIDYVNDYENDDEVIDAIFEHLFSKTTRNEIEIISIVAENEALRDEAERRLSAQSETL